MKRSVSIYSYQEQFYLGKLDLEGCIAKAAETGATGVEMLIDQMVPGYPSLTYNLSDRFVGSWHDLMAKYAVTPTAFDIYGESKVFKGRVTTDAELTAQLVELFKAGKALGFSIMRINFLVPATVIEALVPHAEAMDVKMAIEVHAPHHLDGKWVLDTLEIAQRTGTKHLGIMPDFGTFCRAIPGLALDEARRNGVSEDIISYLSDVYHQREKPKDLVDRVTAMGGNDAAQWLAMRVGIGVWINDDPKLLVPLMPYIFHAHGKFYDVTPDLVEPEVRYDEIMAILIDNNYTGYISSEYEGQRLNQGIDPGYDEIEQVRRHQAMLSRYIGDAKQESTHGSR